MPLAILVISDGKRLQLLKSHFSGDIVFEQFRRDAGKLDTLPDGQGRHEIGSRNVGFAHAFLHKRHEVFELIHGTQINPLHIFGKRMIFNQNAGCAIGNFTFNCKIIVDAAFFQKTHQGVPCGPAMAAGFIASVINLLFDEQRIELTVAQNVFAMFVIFILGGNLAQIDVANKKLFNCTTRVFDRWHSFGKNGPRLQFIGKMFILKQSS